MTTPALPLTPEIARRLRGRPLVLLLDIDGTLSPIAPRPQDAVVPAATRRVLGELAALPDVHVAAVTGRAAADGRRLVGVESLWVIGNHGMELARPWSVPEARGDVARYEPAVAAAADEARKVAARDPGIVVEDKRWTLSVHYRLVQPDVIPDLSRDVERIARDHGLRLTHGKEVLELRPPVAIDKGTATVELAEMLGAGRDGASLLFAGDDRTDEDAFRALRNAQPRWITVRVGADAGAATSAELGVADPNAMYELLTQIAALRRD